MNDTQSSNFSMIKWCLMCMQLCMWTLYSYVSFNKDKSDKTGCELCIWLHFIFVVWWIKAPLCMGVWSLTVMITCLLNTLIKQSPFSSLINMKCVKSHYTIFPYTFLHCWLIWEASQLSIVLSTMIYCTNLNHINIALFLCVCMCYSMYACMHVYCV